jgi:phage terminase large subunit
LIETERPTTSFAVNLNQLQKKSKHQSINEAIEEMIVDRSFFFVKENPVNEKLA